MLSLKEENFLQRWFDQADWTDKIQWRAASQRSKDVYRDLFDKIKGFVLEDIDIEYVKEHLSKEIEDLCDDSYRDGHDEGYNEGYDEGVEKGEENIREQLRDI